MRISVSKNRLELFDGAESAPSPGHEADRTLFETLGEGEHVDEELTALPVRRRCILESWDGGHNLARWLLGREPPRRRSAPC